MHENDLPCRSNKTPRNGNHRDGLDEDGGYNRQLTQSRIKQLSRKVRDHKSKSAGVIELGPSNNGDCPSWLIRHLHNAGPTVYYPTQGAESYSNYQDEERQGGTVFNPDCKKTRNSYPDPKANLRRSLTYGPDGSINRSIPTPIALCISSGSDSLDSKSTKVITTSEFDCDIAQLDIDDFTPDQIQELYSQSQSSRAWSTTSRSYTISPCPDKYRSNSERSKNSRDCRCRLAAYSPHSKRVANNRTTGPNVHDNHRILNGLEKARVCSSSLADNYERKYHNHRATGRLPNDIGDGKKLACHSNKCKPSPNLSNETIPDSIRPSHIRCNLCRDRPVTRRTVEKLCREPTRPDYDQFIDHHFRFTDRCAGYPSQSRSNSRDEDMSNILNRTNNTRDLVNCQNSTTPSQDSCYSLAAQPQTNDPEGGLYSDQLIGSRTSSTSGHASEGSDERDSCFVEASCSPQISCSSSSESLHEECPSYTNRSSKIEQLLHMTNSCERCGHMDGSNPLLSELEDSISHKTATMTVSTDSLDTKISARYLDDAKNRANVMNNYTLTFDNGQISSSTLSSLSQSRQKSFSTKSPSPRLDHTNYRNQNIINFEHSSKNRMVRDETFTVAPQEKYEANLKFQKQGRSCKARPSFKIDFVDSGKREFQAKERNLNKNKMVYPKNNTKSEEGPSGLTTWREVVSLDRELGRKRPETLSDPGTYWFGFDSFGRKSKSPVELILSPENFIDNHTNFQVGQSNETPSPESAGTSGYRSSASGSGGALLSLVSLFRQRKAAENLDGHSRRDDNALANSHQNIGRDLIFSPAEEGEIVFSSHSSSDERSPENHEIREDEAPYRASMCRMGHYVDDITSPDSPPTLCDNEREFENHGADLQHQKHCHEMRGDVNGKINSCQNTSGILSMLQKLILQIISLICLKPAPLLPSDWKSLEPLRHEISQTLNKNGQSQQKDSHLPILLAKQVMQTANKSPEFDPSILPENICAEESHQPEHPTSNLLLSILASLSLTLLLFEKPDHYEAQVNQDNKWSKKGAKKAQIQGIDVGGKVKKSSRLATSTPDTNSSNLVSSSLIKCQSPILSLMEESLKVRSSLLSNSISLSRSGLQNNENLMDNYSPCCEPLKLSTSQISVLSETASTKSLVNECFESQSHTVSPIASPSNQTSPQICDNKVNSSPLVTEIHSSNIKRPGKSNEILKNSQEFFGEIQLGSLYTSSTKISDNKLAVSPDLPDLTFLRQKWLRMRRAEEICYERLNFLTQPPNLEKDESAVKIPELESVKCKAIVSNEKMIKLNGKTRRESTSFMRHSSPIFEVEEEKDEDSVFSRQSYALHSDEGFNDQESLHKTTTIEVYHKDSCKSRNIKSSISCPGELNKMKKTVSFSEQISLHEISDRYSPSPSLEYEVRDELHDQSFKSTNEEFVDSHWLETSSKLGDTTIDQGIMMQTEINEAIKNLKFLDDIPPSHFISDPLLNEIIKEKDYNCSSATTLDNCVNDIYLSICDMYSYFNLHDLMQFWNINDYRDINKRNEILGIINNRILSAKINLSTLGDSRACPDICQRLQINICPSIKILILFARENSDTNFDSTRHPDELSMDKIWDYIIILNKSARSCYPIYMDLVEAIERNSIQHEMSIKSTQSENNLKVNKDTKIDAFICGLINLKCLSTWMELYLNDCVSLQTNITQNVHIEYGFICRLLELLKLLPFRIFLPSILINRKIEVTPPPHTSLDDKKQPNNQDSSIANESQNDSESGEHEIIRLRHELMKRRSRIPVLIRTYPASTLVSPVTNKISSFENENYSCNQSDGANIFCTETATNQNHTRSPSSFVGKLFPKLSLALNEHAPTTCQNEGTNIFSRLTPRLTRKFKEHTNKNNNMDALLSPLSSPFITNGVNLFRRRSNTIPEIQKENEQIREFNDTPTKKVVKKNRFSFRKANLTSPQKFDTKDGKKDIRSAVSFETLSNKNDVKVPPSTLKLKGVYNYSDKNARTENKSSDPDKQCKKTQRNKLNSTLEDKQRSTTSFLVKQTNAPPVSKLVKMKNELTKRFMKSGSQNTYSNPKKPLPTPNEIPSPNIPNTFNSPQMYHYESPQTTTFHPRPKTNDKLMRTVKGNVIEIDLSSHSSESQNSSIGPMVNGVTACSKHINERNLNQNFKSLEKTSSSGESGIGSSDATVMLPLETRDN